LSAKRLPTNNQNQCQLHDKREIKECLLGGSLPDIGYNLTENQNNKNKNGKTKLSYKILSMLFLDLENSDIPELQDLFPL